MPHVISCDQVEVLVYICAFLHGLSVGSKFMCIASMCIVSVGDTAGCTGAAGVMTPHQHHLFVVTIFRIDACRKQTQWWYALDVASHDQVSGKANLKPCVFSASACWSQL